MCSNGSPFLPAATSGWCSSGTPRSSPLAAPGRRTTLTSNASMPPQLNTSGLRPGTHDPAANQPLSGAHDCADTKLILPRLDLDDDRFPDLCGTSAAAPHAAAVAPLLLHAVPPQTPTEVLTALQSSAI